MDDPEGIPEAGEKNEAREQPLPVPESVAVRLLYGLVVVVLPIAAFVCSLVLTPEWQSGDFSAYLGLMLSIKASWPFFFLITYSSVSLVLLLVSPLRYARHFAVRFGIYTGVLLALQYVVLTLPLLAYGGFPLLVLLWWVIPLIYSTTSRRLGSRRKTTLRWLLVGLYLLLYLGTALYVRSVELPLFISLAASLLAAPGWCLYIMAITAFRLFRYHEARKWMTVWRGAGGTAWLAAYAGAWSFNVIKMAELYAALPKVPPPDCYIATSAARGHPRLVGSFLIRREDGQHIWVNRQLQVLKCTELGIAALSPRLHRVLRRCYDVAGRALAARIRTRLAADLAYLSLKPLEWGAHLLLASLISDFDNLAERMYASQQGYN